MAAGQQFMALYDFTSTGEGILSFKSGEHFTLVSKTDENWWTVRSVSGEKGLAPITYLEACPVRNGGPAKSAAYTTIYDYTAQEPTQLSFSRGQTLSLVDKTDVSWWTMRTSDGKQGIVPVNYIDKLDLPESSVVNSVSPPSRHNSGSSGVCVVGESTPHVNSHSSLANSSSGSLPEPPPEEEEGFQQALTSIDSNIARIHAEATKQGGRYSASQKDTLRKLVLHRQSFVLANNPPIPEDSAHSSRPANNSPPKSPKSPKKSLTPHQSPVPKRHAPPPPTSPEKVNNGSAKKGSPRRRGSTDDIIRCPQNSRIQDNRYSVHVNAIGEYQYEGKTLQSYGSLSRHTAPGPPNRQAEERNMSVQGTTDQRFYSLQRSPPKSRPSSSTLSPAGISYSPKRRASDQPPIRQPSSPEKPTRSSSQDLPVRQPSSPKKNVTSFSHDTPRHDTQQSSSPGKAPHRSSSQDIPRHSNRQPNSPEKRTRSLSYDLPHQYSLSVGNIQGGGGYDQNKSLSSSPSSRGSSKEREIQTTLAPPPVTTPMASALSPPPPPLPTSFSAKDGAELVETVRKMAGITHRKAQQAVGGVLQFLKKQVPQCEGMVDGLFAALEQAMHNNSISTVPEQHSDLERLKEIMFDITECKDDSQQRGWAVHDDEKAISELLEEMLQILCDANPEVSKMAVMEDKYENVLTLITYYQMEPRVPIRLLLLKVFGVLCGLDRTIIGILLASVLPNELGRDIQQNMSELQKALYSSTVCTMIFSTTEAVPLSVYDQWDVNYIMFLLDTIEVPPEADDEEQLPDAFLNMVLAFNQHFPDPDTNLVMKALKQRPNPRNFSEKLMFLINRGEDPVAIAEPCCPDSITKFLLDLFSEKSTAGIFYTTDMRVLIDIVVRQLTDLCPGMATRTHYLELLYRIVASTDYRDHLHRQRDLVACLNRVMNEEEADSHADRELVKKIWMAYPQVFEEITDL